MKFIRDKVRPYYTKMMYKIFLTPKYSGVFDKKDIDRFVNWGVSFTNIAMNVGLFLSMYYILIKVLYVNIGFEKTILVAIIIIIAMLRAFLEEFT